MKTTQIKYWPILGIIIIVLIIGFFLTQKGYKGLENGLSVLNIGSEEGQRLQDIRFINDSSGEGLRWVLDAKELKFSEDSQHITFSNFRLKFEPENGASLELSGKTGEINRSSNEINLTENIQGLIGNGYTINTEHIFYRQKDDCLTTDRPVKITGPFFSVSGNGLNIDMGNKTLKITSNAITIIDRKALIL